MFNRIVLLFLACLTIISLSACITTPFPLKHSTPQGNHQTRAIEAEKSGNFSTAGQQYLLHAATLNSPQKEEITLRAASAYAKAGHPQKALDILGQIDRDQLSYPKLLDAAVLEADIFVSENKAEQALSILSPYDLSRAPAIQQKSALQVKIRAYEITENWVDKAYSHIALSRLLGNDDSAQENNRHTLWQSLMMLEPDALSAFRPGHAPAIGSGWFALASIVKSNSGNAHSLKAAIAHWQRDYPNHPADTSLYNNEFAGNTSPSTSFQAGDVDDSSIAILLPDSGPYASVANAIRQGFTAAHYAEDSPASLNFYAVKTDASGSNIAQQYQQAINEGASIVVGPLNKAALETLSQSGPLPVPVLALNRLSGGVYVDNLYQFGLSPEDEARSVADFAQSRGYYRALILAPENDWGSRIVTAFNDQWRMASGETVDTAWYNTKDNDFASVIRPLMKRRNEADFVFLVARPQLARQLMPQLRFHYLQRMPVIATSHVYNGQENPRQDIDLNPIFTTDMPWIFKGIAENDPAYQQLMSLNPENLTSLKRFYALGVDAYRLIPQLSELSQYSNSVFNGATGQITINEFGHVRRKTITGQFKKGILTPLLTRTVYE